MLMRSWIWTPLLLVILAAGSYAAYRWLAPPTLPDGFLYGGGRIEGTEVTVASEVSARVLDSALVEGAEVQRGQELVRLDAKDLQTQLERVLAERESARRERDRLQRDLQTARHHAANLRVDDERYATLVRDGRISVQRRDQAANALAEAVGRTEGLETSLVEASERIEAADKSVELAQSQLGKTSIAAPLTGTVLTKSIEPGEFATPGRPIATLVDLTRIEVKIYVPEKDVGKLRLGHEARIRTDAFPDRFIAGSVSRVDQQAQFTPRDIHVPDERTRLVFGVTLAVDNPAGLLKPGMPVDAWVRWDAGVDWPADLVVPR